MRLSNKLLRQGYVKECLKSSLRKFYGRYGDLVKQYEAPSPDVTRHSWWWPYTVTTSIDQALRQFLILLLMWTLLPNLTFYLIARGFHRTIVTGAACQQRTLTPPDTWSFPTLGLASVLMLGLISPEIVLFPDFWDSNIPWYFCFAPFNCIIPLASLNFFRHYFGSTFKSLTCTLFGAGSLIRIHCSKRLYDPWWIFPSDSKMVSRVLSVF